MLITRINLITYLSLGWISLFPLLVNAAEPEEADKPVPIAAQEQITLKVETPVPAAAQEEQETSEKTKKDTNSPSQKTTAKEQSEEEESEDPLSKAVKKLQLEQSKIQLEHEEKLLKLRLEKDKLSLENELYQVRQAKLLTELNALKTRLELENALQELQQRKLLATLQVEREKLEMQNALQAEKNRQEEMNMQLQMMRMEFKRANLSGEISTLERQIATRTQQQEWDSQVNQPKEYLKDPFIGGQLIISDRKIVLDGIIWPGTANNIVERIQYYNNKSTEYPIFLVIDYCPGGSVMEGTRIVKAMKKSRAPVYVVVKALAASMAAVITTLADHSYALPDAIIVHHQVWGMSFGNRTEQREQLKIIDEWSERIMGPVAEKMDMTLNDLVKKMYQHNSAGDWIEFANAAVKYKWVGNIVEDIRDWSYTKQPVEKEEDDFIFIMAQQEKIDAQGKRYVKLPRLRPMDVYHLYNQDNYYR
ncbi:secreted protein [Beggiatoa sp. PS]|nr:secreted protein [Beggiatoa sp. PS]